MTYYAHFKFKYPGKDKEEEFDYKIPDDIFMEALRDYVIKKYNVALDGTDNAVWNMVSDISRHYGNDYQYCEFFDEVEEQNQAFFQEKLKDDAFEAFKENWEYDHEENESLKEDVEDPTIAVGDKVIVHSEDKVWDNKEGEVKKIADGKADVLVDFLPDKQVMQTFPIEALSKTDSMEPKEEGLKEDMKTIENIDWNGHHYTFDNEFKSTGTKSHDILIMTDEDGNEYKGETTWINRPWHRFDLEEAWCEIVKKAFGSKALKIAREVNKTANSVFSAIGGFFAKVKPEDIGISEEDKINSSEEGRKAALAKYLEVSPEELSEEGGNTFGYDDAEYVVLTDEEADDTFDSNVRDFWYNMGLEAVSDSFKDWIFNNALDDSAFEDLVREDIENQVADMYDDEDVVRECVDECLVDEEDIYDEEGTLKDDVDIDDLKEKLIDYKVENIINKESFGEWLQEIGYDDSYLSNYIDEEKVIDALKDDIEVNGSGRGQEIATYDGDELDLDNGLFAYRIN